MRAAFRREGHLLGDNDRGQAEAPGGRFTALTAGDASTYGLRPDGPIVCWDELPAIRPPVGVKEGESDPGVVRVLDKPTTRQIAYTSADLDDPGVFVIDADGSDERQLTLNDRVSESPAWPPDGTRIAFSSERDDGILVMDADGRRNKQLTEQGGRDPAWSPDGTSIAFTRDGQVFVVNADGTDERQQTTFRSVRIPHVCQPRAARWLVASDWWLVIAVGGQRPPRSTSRPTDAWQLSPTDACNGRFVACRSFPAFPPGPFAGAIAKPDRVLGGRVRPHPSG